MLHCRPISSLLQRSSGASLSLLGLFLFVTSVLPLAAQTLYVPGGAVGATVAGNGNVGIGTSAPVMKLDVNSSVGVTDGIRFAGMSHAWLLVRTSAVSGNSAGVELVGGASGADWLMLTNRGDISPNADDLIFYKNVAGTGSQGAKLTIQSGGNVGIGTTTPTHKVTIDSGANSNIFRAHTAGDFIFSLAGDGLAGSNVDLFSIRNANTGVVHLNTVNGARMALGVSSGANSGSTAESMTLTAAGNVGVGVTNPGSKLVIGATTGVPSPGSSALAIVDGSSPAYGFDFTLEGISSGDLSLRRVVNDTASTMMTFQRATGNVGIGTTNPGARVHVIATTQTESSTVNFTDTLRLQAATGTDGAVNLQTAWDNSINSSKLNLRMGYYTSGSQSRDALTIIANTGNVGIGTTSPTHKLAVNGTIRAKEVIVDTAWADHVFAKGYRLTPLTEVERRIEKEGHLPDIPSAAEVAERGVSVGEMQKLLLQKIEELTLHLIAVEKRTQALEADNARLKIGK